MAIEHASMQHNRGISTMAKASGTEPSLGKNMVAAEEAIDVVNTCHKPRPTVVLNIVVQRKEECHPVLEPPLNDLYS